jgi:hypothetical protein
MPTKFGLKSKPTFKIVRWYRGDDAAPSEVSQPRLGGSSAPQELKEPSTAAEMDDEIPW